MGAILTAFGIDWRLLIVNTVNFAIVLAALSYFLYKPLMAMLEERRQKVAQGVHEAEEAHARLEEIESSRDAKLADAGREADEVLARARQAATESGKKILAEREAAAARLIQEAHKEAEEVKAKALAQSKEEVAKLIVLGVEKTLAHHTK
jgi:F-type H+-transporting ATPase subunit b